MKVVSDGTILEPILGRPVFEDGLTDGDVVESTLLSGRPISLTLFALLPTLARERFWPAAKPTIRMKRRAAVQLGVPMRLDGPEADEECFRRDLQAWLDGPALLSRAVYRQDGGDVRTALRTMSAAAFLSDIPEGGRPGVVLHESAWSSEPAVAFADGRILSRRVREEDGLDGLIEGLARRFGLCGHSFEEDEDGCLRHAELLEVLPRWEGGAASAAEAALSAFDGSPGDGLAGALDSGRRTDRWIRTLREIGEGGTPLLSGRIDWSEARIGGRRRAFEEREVPGTAFRVRWTPDGDNAGLAVFGPAPCPSPDGGRLVWGERWTCAGRFLVDHLKRPLPKQPKKTFFDVGSSFDRLPSATIEDAVLWAEGAILNGADAGDGVDADVGEGATSAFADVLDLLKSSLGGSWRVEAAWCPRSYSRSGWDGRFGDKPSVRSTVPREYDSWGVHDALDRLAQAEIAALGFGCAFETWHDGIAMPVQAKVRLQAGERSGHELLEARMRLGFRSVRSIPGWVEAAAALDGLLPGVLPQGALRKTRRRKAA